MSFLQPMLLAALPLVALPILIHLINQWRYQTVRWGAMMFLLAANRMSRGYARLRQWLIMAFRMLAIAGLVFAVCRPLAGGWLGLAAGGRADTTIVLLDRSPSMEQESAGGGGSKRETGLRQIARALETLGSSRWVLIEGGTVRPRELESPDALRDAPGTGPSSASADIPAMLMAARDYIRANKPGRTEVWICSDLRENDWDPEGGRWQALRDAFLEFPQGVRFHLLAYPQIAPGNLGVRVTDVRRQKGRDGAELLVSLRLWREGSAEAGARRPIPVHFEVDGARSEVTVEMTGPQQELKDHRIPLGHGQARGWGRVSIPADANPADDEFYFVYDEPAPRRTAIVVEDPQAARPLELAAAISPDPSLHYSSETVASADLATVEWDKIALLLWQAPLPTGDAAERVRAFIERGGSVLFFPPRAPGDAAFLGVRWTSWTSADGKGVAVENWRGDQDVLAHTQSGAPLPVGALQVRKSCGLSGEFTPLATLRGGAPLLARVSTSRGGAYFCATTPAPGDSSLATDGVVLYVLVQRALAAGASVLGSTRQVVAGAPPGDLPTPWERLAGPAEAISTEYPLHRGVYSTGGKLLAVNRPAAEDSAPVLADRRVAGLFRGLDYDRIDDRAGSAGALVQEIWRIFLVAMMTAMLVEAWLCLPRTRPAGTRL
jgi:hypothetical protein